MYSEEFLAIPNAIDYKYLWKLNTVVLYVYLLSSANILLTKMD